MAELGLASRREADDWIARGWVKVNGQVAEMGMQVTPDARIEVNKQAQGQQANQVTILLNKPMGIVSGQAEDGHLPAITLVQPQNRWADDNARFFFHPSQLKSLVPAGRLDIDSIGLLVLTQDGRVARQLIGEDSGMEKEYLVRVIYTGVLNTAAATSAAATYAAGPTARPAARSEARSEARPTARFTASNQPAPPPSSAALTMTTPSAAMCNRSSRWTNSSCCATA